MGWQANASPLYIRSYFAQSTKMLAEEYIVPGKRCLAAPSWVFPGKLDENCIFLAGKVQEVGLLFFESASALAYGPADLPLSLAALPLTWHVHLPSDLPWPNVGEAAGICLELMDKLDFLGVKRAVLHPPSRAEATEKAFVALLEQFVVYWVQSGRDSKDILLENQPDDSPEALLGAARACDASLCLDLAHYLMAGNFSGGLPKGFMERVRLLHLCAPASGGKKGHHHPLTALDEAGCRIGREICRAARPDTVFMLELFNWTDFVNSMPVLKAWLE